MAFNGVKRMELGLWLGQRRRGSTSQTHLEQITALVNGLPKFIYLAGLKLYGLIANTANGQVRSESSHFGVPFRSDDRKVYGATPGGMVKTFRP
jgi:hypothetical protein